MGPDQAKEDPAVQKGLEPASGACHPDPASRGPPSLPWKAFSVPLVTGRPYSIFFFFLIEQIFIEHLLQAVPTLLPPWPLKQANSSSKSHLSEKAPLTPLPPSHPQVGQGVPLSLSVPPSIMVGS